MNANYRITTIDTGLVRPRFAASHLLVEGDRAAFVDVGTTHAVPHLLQALRRAGLDVGDVEYVMVTHVHLDHAGGAGALLRHLPKARLLVHPRGSRHMASPDKLVAGATAVYGRAVMAQTFGTVVPVPADRIMEVGDGQVVGLNGRQLMILHTPGHARHHYCVVDEASHGIFPGDTFGVSYRELDTSRGAFILPTTTPVQFEPNALHSSVDRLMSFAPGWMYLTHYGCVRDTERLAADLHAGIDTLVSLALEHAGDHDGLASAMSAWLLRRVVAHGCELPASRIRELLAPDVELNTSGLEVWLERRQGSDT